MSGFAEGMGIGLQNVSGYTSYREHLELFDGDKGAARNAAWNPVYLAMRGFTEAGSGTGLQPSNLGESLTTGRRVFSAFEGALGTVGAVTGATGVTRTASASVAAFREGLRGLPSTVIPVAEEAMVAAEAPIALPHPKYLFKADEAVSHFDKHAESIMNAMGNKSYNLAQYVDDANHIVQNGTWVPEMNGFVKLIGGQGSAKFGFVGVERGSSAITTFHIKTASELAKKAPSLRITP
jgi:hypothetical protein